MKKKNVKVKENITIIDEINAIESIVSYYFTDDEYTPYYAEVAEINAIARFFLEGIEFEEDDDVYSIVLNDPEIYALILKFYFDIEESEEAKQRNKDNELYISIRSRILSHVHDMVEYEKAKRLSNAGLRDLVEGQNTLLSNINEFINVMVSSFNNFAKLDVSQMSPENINTVVDFMKQMKNKEFSEDTLANALRKAANKHKVPNTKIYEEQRKRIEEQQRQLIDQNKEISGLKKQIKKLDAFNVQADS